MHITTIVCPRNTAAHILNRCSAIACLVSIGNTHSLTPAHYTTFEGPKLRLEFDDITHADSYAAIRMGYVPVASADIRILIDFYQEIMHSVHGFALIHCEAGISRSPAAALILNYMLCGDALEAARATWRHSHGMLAPNDLMLTLADTELGLKGTLAAAGKCIGEMRRAEPDLSILLKLCEGN